MKGWGPSGHPIPSCWSPPHATATSSTLGQYFFTASQTGTSHHPAHRVAPRAEARAPLSITAEAQSQGGMRKQFLAFGHVCHHDRGRPNRQCPIAVGSQCCLHGMRIPFVLVIGCQGARNTPLRNRLRPHFRSSSRGSQNAVERPDTIVNNMQ